MFKIWQINFDAMEVALINARSNDVINSKYNLYLNTITGGSAEKVEPVWMVGLYQKVAEIAADSLNKVYEVGNIGPEENIKRLAPMHSISVGDVIEDKYGNLFSVASFGFEPLFAAKQAA